ncbi:hypothetical protein SCBWM1_gp107 [Synechococcus phage S-CBWM1]|uniref:Uncharacterized protein n=1 Tax=Synechococcus phage S-CBWM1 TaxID=2053653 RepID=A0A3G1L3N2_9CAUD|nr:hypothetical protein HOU61_gp090 [Synechococcus phage S-CBWM1]ATW62791.1 hypothetical protein SCBWM1_gp107 [Synechococcus phage S-CBWM1]
MSLFPRPPIEEALEDLPSRIIESTEGRFYWQQFWGAEDPSHAAFIYRTYRDSQHVDFPQEDLRIMRDLIIELMRRENKKSKNPIVENQVGNNIEPPDSLQFR